MKSAVSGLILIALAALGAMSLAPAGLVGARGGFASPAGWITALALAALAAAGGWLWWRQKRTGDD